LDKEIMGKECKVEEGCNYFESVVVPGILEQRDIKTIQRRDI